MHRQRLLLRSRSDQQPASTGSSLPSDTLTGPGFPGTSSDPAPNMCKCPRRQLDPTGFSMHRRECGLRGQRRTALNVADKDGSFDPSSELWTRIVSRGPGKFGVPPLGLSFCMPLTLLAPLARAWKEAPPRSCPFTELNAASRGDGRSVVTTAAVLPAKSRCVLRGTFAEAAPRTGSGMKDPSWGGDGHRGAWGELRWGS
jgi:hypothetical protein